MLVVINNTGIISRHLAKAVAVPMIPKAVAIYQPNKDINRSNKLIPPFTPHS
jgi:hypothetical protein